VTALPGPARKVGGSALTAVLLRSTPADELQGTGKKSALNASVSRVAKIETFGERGGGRSAAGPRGGVIDGSLIEFDQLASPVERQVGQDRYYENPGRRASARLARSAANASVRGMTSGKKQIALPQWGKGRTKATLGGRRNNTGSRERPPLYSRPTSFLQVCRSR